MLTCAFHSEAQNDNCSRPCKKTPTAHCDCINPDAQETSPHAQRHYENSKKPQNVTNHYCGLRPTTSHMSKAPMWLVPWWFSKTGYPKNVTTGNSMSPAKPPAMTQRPWMMY